MFWERKMAIIFKRLLKVGEKGTDPEEISSSQASQEKRF